ncbi:MAG: dTDP-4-dehydrorhamnose 3,5-epimerase family protein [Nitrospirae bacterium]|nr:dTDP-4-dehydrorhamnose 3,5-epimerase family protein [Nitrospirota bacterium]
MRYKVEGLLIKELSLFKDNRGWLGEIIREDESEIKPVMSYLSMTNPGLVRGPHEHKEQTDVFCFIGRFRVYLWDNRKTSATYRESKTIDTDVPTVVIVPPGIVHAYRNTGDGEGIVINLPDRLYKGWGKKEPVDEVRYEEDPLSPFRMNE